MSVSPQQAAAELLRRRAAVESLIGFAKYVQPEDMQPVRHHLLLMHELQRVLDGETQYLIVMMPPGSAKALALDTPIPTPSGWKAMGDLAVGDEVFDERGVPCRVTWVSPVWRNRPVYRVRTDCGDEIVADRDHEWLVRLCGKREVYKIKETHELHRKRSKRPMIRKAGALSLPDVDLPVDPYLLGVWLGDGTSSSMSITSSDDDRPWLRGELGRLGYETSDRSVRTLFGVLGVRDKFVAMGLVNDPAHATYGRKHIPASYMRASAAQRLALLQGLVDTGGTVCKRRGSTTFCSTNEELAGQVRELVRSLGVKAGWSEGRAMLKGRDCGPVFRVSFYLAGSARMPRKAALTRNQRRTPGTYVEVDPAGIADTVCIEVDSPSHLFLCGRSMTPTHNSTYASVITPAYFLGKNPQLSVIEASHTLELAEKFGRKTRNLLQSQEVCNLWQTRVASDNAAAGRWATDQGGEYLAVGVRGAVTGNRADLAIIDDPVKSREEADSDLIRERTWEWFRDDLRTRLKPGGRVVVVLTRWHEDDLVGRLLKREPGKWKVLKLPMEAGPNDPLGRAEGERLWKEWFTDEMVSVAKADPRGWSSLYQQEPRAKEGAEFKRAWIMRWVVRPKGLNHLILVDPSSGREGEKRTKKGNDYTSMWVVGLGADQNAYVVDLIRDRLQLHERIDALFELHRKYRPLAVRYEQYGMQADIQAIRMEMERRQYRFRLVEVGGQVSKEARIRRLITWFEAGRIWLPPEGYIKRVVGGVERDPVQQFIDEEYAAFPLGTHDDAFDALARLVEPGLTLPWPAEQADEGFQVPDWGVLDPVVNY